MKRRYHGFSFLGFVALADLIFAVSAGLLLLNPLTLADLDSPEDAVGPDLLQLTNDIDAAEREIAGAEQSLPEVERALHGLTQGEVR
jgi:hypothetical protein